MKRHVFTKSVGDVRDSEGLLAYLERFILHRQMQGVSDTGIYNIERYVRDFIGWCDVRGLRRPIDITKPILEAYQRYLFYYRKKNGEPLSSRSRSACIVPLKAYFKWLAKENYLPFNPASELELPKSPHRLPAMVMNAKEAEKVLHQADVGTLCGIRDRSMMELLYATGIRRMEIAGLNYDNVDLLNGTLLVREGKFRRDRLLPIGERALYWLKRYLMEVRPEYACANPTPALYLSQLGTRLNKCWLSTTVAGYVKKAKIGKQGGCHLFRHTMATLMLDGGADIRFVQGMLGHADLKSTQIYTHISIEKLRKVHEATHPAKLPKGASLDVNPDIEAIQDILSEEAKSEHSLLSE